MAPYSMTGFGRAEVDVAGARFSVELTSVNQKSLQISVFGPDAWPALETAVSGWIKPKIQRGKLTARISSVSSPGAQRQWDADAVSAGLEELARVAARCGVKFEADADIVLRLAESGRKHAHDLPDFSVAEPILRNAVDQALDRLLAMREKEGRALGDDLLRRVDALRTLVGMMESSEKGAPARHRDAMLRRLKEAGIALDLADERVLRELALFADRCDITEEIVRLRSHLSQFADELPRPGAGRKLDFLVQELLREVNTVGSKASEIDTTRAVLEAKTEIERIREQVQNLE
jgi:uncharacterized protein (TIGR00255 family)